MVQENTVNRIPLIVVAGPTASGKTACAVALAKALRGEIVSADSMQIYRGMALLSAQPSEEERGGVPHHMLGVADPRERYTASKYRAEAGALVREIYARGKVPIVCGGTGLYIDALTKPMGFSVEADPKLHGELMAMADEPGGARKLHDTLIKIDPDMAKKLHPNDVRRVVRAIEVYRLSGVTQTEHLRRDAEKKGDFDERLFVLTWERERLYERIDRRVDDMVARGLIDEVRALHDREDAFPTAVQAIGYKEIVDALEGRRTMEEAIDTVKQATRNFAKRQMTWFRRDARSIPIEASEKTPEAVAKDILNRLRR